MAAGPPGNVHLLGARVLEEDVELLGAYAGGIMQAGEVLVRRFSDNALPGGDIMQGNVADLGKPEFDRLHRVNDDVEHRHGGARFPVPGLHVQEFSVTAVEDYSASVIPMVGEVEPTLSDAGLIPVVDHLAQFGQPHSVHVSLLPVDSDGTISNPQPVYNDFYPMLQEIEQLSRVEANNVNFASKGDETPTESFLSQDIARLCKAFSATVPLALEQNTQDSQNGSSRDRQLCVLLGLVVVVLQQIMSLLPSLGSGRKRQRRNCSVQQHLHDIAEQSRNHTDDEGDENSRLLPVVAMYQMNLKSLLLAIAKDGEELESAPRGMDWFSEYQMGLYNDERWIENLRMRTGTFNFIMEALRPHCTKQMTNFKKPICVELKVAACIFKLVTGSTLAKTSQVFNIGKATVYDIMREIIPAIVQVFGQRFTWPSGPYMHEIMENFQKRTGLPNCIGAIGTCHISIVQHSKLQGGRNKKQKISYAVQTVCDHNLRFTDVFVSMPSYGHDSKVLRSSALWKLVNTCRIFNDSPDTFPSGVLLPSYIVGDSSFPNLHWLITPFKHYGRRPLTEAEKEFNHRVHLGQGLVGNAFTVLRTNFQELARPSRLAAGYLPKVITACMCLYNVLLDFNDLDTASIVSQVKEQESRSRCLYQVIDQARPSRLHKDDASGDMLREGLVDWLQSQKSKQS